MKNLQYSGGERNRYFYGKLMTVRDFEGEQTYFNDKRRLGNRMLHGAGIVSGLGVLYVDNQTFSLEAGMALDYLGREIVVQQASVKRLSIIKGFDQIQGSGDVYLGIAYREDMEEETFSVAGMERESGAAQEYNRVRESYELFLTARRPNPAALGLDSVLYDFRTLYDRSGITITLRTPRFVRPDSGFTARVLFEKRNVSAPVQFSFRLTSDLFRGEDGERFAEVSYTEEEVTTCKNITLDCSMACGPVADDYTQLCVPAEMFRLTCGNREEPGLDGDVEWPVEVTAQPLRETVTRAYYTRHFDDLLTATEDQAIYLAKFHIISSQSNLFIENIVQNPFGQYLPNTQLLTLLQGLDGPDAGFRTADPAASREPEAPPVLVPQGCRVISGVENISLGVAPKVGRTYFSHEFIHGLGAGNVCVVTAAEYADGPFAPSTLVFGSNGIFMADEFSLAGPSCASAALVNVERGTLQLGVKLLERTGLQFIRLRWWAWKASEEEEMQAGILTDGIRVVITPNTANVEPLQQIRFTAMVKGSTDQEVNWSVAEKEGGSIDRNGLYTAPAGEGVFEIQAQSAKYGTCRASAYVVVGKL